MIDFLALILSMLHLVGVHVVVWGLRYYGSGAVHPEAVEVSSKSKALVNSSHYDHISIETSLSGQVLHLSLWDSVWVSESPSRTIGT